MKNQTQIKVYVDGNEESSAVFNPPGRVEIDTRELRDGNHVFKIVATDADGVQNTKAISLVVRNGPYIVVNGLKSGEVVDGKLSMLIDAYDETSVKDWQPSVIEAPNAVSFWFWGLFLIVFSVALYYGIAFYNPDSQFLKNKTMEKQIKIENVTTDYKNNQ